MSDARTIDSSSPTPSVPLCPQRIAIIGGGISGLAAAHRIVTRSSTAAVTIFEASPRLGGIIRTERHDDFLIELGPDSFITNKPGGIELCDELGLSSQLISTDERYRRSLVLRDGRPLAVPDGFQLMQPNSVSAVLRSPLLSAEGKLRFIMERFEPPRSETDDETVAAFVIRRFGREVFERLVQPLIGGIYTADPHRLSLLATLPRFIQMEREHGSLIRAAAIQQNATRSSSERSAANDGGARYGMFASLADGMESLVTACRNALSASLRATVRISEPVSRLRFDVASKGGWIVETKSGSIEHFNAVIVTLPAHQAAALLTDEAMLTLKSELAAIEYASSAIVISAHNESDFSNPLSASGLVIPAIERRDVLAVSFSSRKFRGRAPDGTVLLRTFIGGAMQPEILDRSDDELLQTVTRELQSMLGLHAPPLFTRVLRYNRAMPQYVVGHVARVARIEQLLSLHPTLQLAGSTWHGVGLPDSISSGRAAADAVVSGPC